MYAVFLSLILWSVLSCIMPVSYTVSLSTSHKGASPMPMFLKQTKVSTCPLNLYVQIFTLCTFDTFSLMHSIVVWVCFKFWYHILFILISVQTESEIENYRSKIKSYIQRGKISLHTVGIHKQEAKTPACSVYIETGNSQKFLLVLLTCMLKS